MTGYNRRLAALARLDRADLMGRYLLLAGRGTGTGRLTGYLEAHAAAMSSDALMAALLDAGEKRRGRRAR